MKLKKKIASRLFVGRGGLSCLSPHVEKLQAVFKGEKKTSAVSGILL